MVKKIEQKFKDIYNTQPRLFRAPGRINLIGEHTDYNDGFVFPAAIDKNILLAIKLNDSKKGKLYAYDLADSLEIELENIQKSDKQWANYILGVIDEFHKKGFNIQGFDCVFGGNIPLGAGLSSSAALESVFTYAFDELHNFGIEKTYMIKMAQMAEVNFVGVNCGIMDQFISFRGIKDKAIKLDCRDLDYEYCDIKLDGYSIILADTLVKHSLASGEYNIRKQQCEEGVEILKNFYPTINSLRDLNVTQLKKVKSHFNQTIYNRCKYVIEENKRVLNASKYLKNNNVKDFGQELFKSHDGLSKLYEVSCDELDFLVALAKEKDYITGARMMGGGFGGCTINIVKTEDKDDFKEQLGTDFYKSFGHKPKFYSVKIKNGTEAINI